MAKVIAICGKICSGKTYYAYKMAEKENAIILSCDELTKELFDNDLGDAHDEKTYKIWKYFMKKSIELINIGCNVIIDWGFWTLKDRQYIKEFYKSNNITCEWHYIDVDSDLWKHNIEERNQKILDGNGGYNYYLDDGLMKKLLSRWETPDEKEIDVWYELKRDYKETE